MVSQLGQDRLVLQLLGGLRAGFFLDTGAADGVTASNTYVLEKQFGWSGVCVEPNDAMFADLAANRQCRCVHCCLSDREGLVDYLEAGMLGGIIDEYDPKHLAYAIGTFRLPVDEQGQPRTVQKPARTLRSVLRQANAPPVIDYWSLDTEGSELTLLKSFPYDEFAFRVVTVEHNHLPVRADIGAFLTSRGYEFLCNIGIDDCYIAGSAQRVGPPPMDSWRSRAWRR